MPAVGRHFYSCKSPVLSMIVPFVLSSAYTCTLQSLIVREGSQDAKDDGDTCVHLDLHESMRNTVTDVLEMHGCSLNKNTDGYNGVKWCVGHENGGWSGGRGAGSSWEFVERRGGTVEIKT
jgi:hypothetical protein